MLKPEPVVLFAVHPADCRCGRTACRTPVTIVARQPSLITRFRDAAIPGEWAALAIGAQLGALLLTMIVVADNWDVISPILAALW